MASRSPARLLAPASLVAFVIALIIVVGSSGGGDEPIETGAPRPTATATSGEEAAESSTETKKKAKKAKKTYTIQAGDTPSGIAEAHGLTTDEFLALNPDLDPNALTVGDEVRVQ